MNAFNIALVLGFPLALLYANATEWFVHKYLLHGLGANKKSFWSFHWHDHHKASRQSEMIDEKYQGQMFRKWDSQAKEAVALLGGALIHLPLIPFVPTFVAGVFASSILYYFVHRRSHLDEEWAKKRVPWHWDHHMGPNQHANWCVTYPLFDHILGTREVYFDTPDEVATRERRKVFADRRKQRLAESKLADVKRTTPAGAESAA